MPSPLSKKEQQILRRCEDAIQSRQSAAFYAVGEALRVICDMRLYRERFGSFERYCKERLRIRRSYAYSQMAAARVVDRIGPTAIPPTHESQTRPLALLLELPDVDFAGIWQDVVSTAPNGNVTARHVRAVARRHCGHRLGTNDRRFGEPIDFRGLRHAPINELGVVFLFGAVSRELGFIVESIQAEYRWRPARGPVSRREGAGSAVARWGAEWNVG